MERIEIQHPYSIVMEPVVYGGKIRKWKGWIVAVRASGEEEWAGPIDDWGIRETPTRRSKDRLEKKLIAGVRELIHVDQAKTIEKTLKERHTVAYHPTVYIDEL